VVDVLSANSRGNTLAVGGVLNAALVSKASLVVDQGPLSGIGIAVVKLAVLNSTELSSVLLWQDLTVVDGLDSAVVVVLVNLLVNGSVNLLVYVRLDDLVLNSGGNCLVDSGVVVTGTAHEVGDSCLGLVHFDYCVVVVCWVVVLVWVVDWLLVRCGRVVVGVIMMLSRCCFTAFLYREDASRTNARRRNGGVLFQVTSAGADCVPCSQGRKPSSRGSNSGLKLSESRSMLLGESIGWPGARHKHLMYVRDISSVGSA